MTLFELKNYEVQFSPQALMLAPFKEIWNNDSSKDKETANKEMAYVYYMADNRSNYMYVLDDDERSDLIRQALELDDDWIKSEYIDEAIVYYKKMSETTSTKLLESTRGVIHKISHFLDTIDPNERDKANKPVFNISQIVASVEKMPKLIKAMNDIEREVIKEKELKGQAGNRETGLFDDSGI